MKLKRIKHIPVWFIIALVVAVIGVGVNIYGAVQPKKQVVVETPRPFPSYLPGELTEAQQRITNILKTEYSAQPAGTKYTEGAQEPWCADFVSWVMNQNGTPLYSPRTKSWRVTGTMGLQQFFVEQGTWHQYGDGYIPKPGDVALYDGSGPYGQHANFVLSYKDGTLTTIGGNELGTIRIQHRPLNDELQVFGFAEYQG